jgi:glyoxylase-like metal-dependent hydrolase (beta-lactamase superfamily II)
VVSYEIPAAGPAEVHVLHEGYAGRGDDERVGPGMVAPRQALLSALASYGPGPAGVVFSHHHPDHTVNAALFPASRMHDHWVVYRADRWVDRDADGALFRPGAASGRDARGRSVLA